MDVFENEKQDVESLLSFLKIHKNFIGLALIIGLAIGAVSYFISPKQYSSYGIIYPANSHAREQVISNPQFGHDVEAEQLMQLLESRSIMDSVIHKFNLINYYQIDTANKDWRDLVYLKYIKDINFERTKYLSIVINATLKEPKLAANVVNYIIKTVDEYKAKIFRENIEKDLEFMKNQVLSQGKKLEALKKRIYSAKDTANTENIIENFLLKSSKDQYYESDYINTPEMAVLVDEYRIQKQKYIDWSKDYIGAQEMAKRPILGVYVVDSARAAYKPTSPKLFYNLLIGAVLGVFISILLLVLKQLF
ncbi:MAG: hypothetical protein KDC92_03465 [Bacteroidetes bacterium]|nr:hypothetical protein [Bacteroidota bacterium]